jgi:hypothetical protein
LDSYLRKLSNRLRRPINIVSTRKAMAGAAVAAARYEIHVREEFPKKSQEAAELLAKLEAVRASIRELTKIDPVRLSEVLIPIDKSDGSDPAGDEEEVEIRTSALKNAFQSMDVRLENYLETNVLPTYATPSNKTDCFIQKFVENASDTWRKFINKSLDGTHRSDFANLVGTALDDFGFRRIGIQVGNDDSSGPGSLGHSSPDAGAPPADRAGASGSW